MRNHIGARCHYSIFSGARLIFPSAALETSTLAYLAAHFDGGVASVFSVPGSSDRFIIQIVANKYNAPNFWFVCSFCISLPVSNRARSGRGDGDPNTPLTSERTKSRVKSSSMCTTTSRGMSSCPRRTTSRLRCHPRSRDCHRLLRRHPKYLR